MGETVGTKAAYCLNPGRSSTPPTRLQWPGSRPAQDALEDERTPAHAARARHQRFEDAREKADETAPWRAKSCSTHSGRLGVSFTYRLHVKMSSLPALWPTQ